MSLTTLGIAISGTIQYLLFCDWLISRSIISSRFIEAVVCVRISFLFRLNHIPLYVCITFCSSIHLSMDTWVASTFFLLWIMLLWIWVYRYLFKTLISILLGICPEVKLLDHMIILCLIYWGTSIMFYILAAPFYIPNNTAQVF